MSEKRIDPLCETCGFPHSNIAHVIDHLFVLADDQPEAVTR